MISASREKRFLQTSGIDVSFSASGLSVRTQSAVFSLAEIYWKNIRGARTTAIRMSGPIRMRSCLSPLARRVAHQRSNVRQRYL
jgi:hypothetical protein